MEQLNLTQKQLSALYEQSEWQLFFSETDTVVIRYVNKLWKEMISNKRIDLNEPRHVARITDADTKLHTDSKEIGTKRVCHDVWQNFDSVLY